MFVTQKINRTQAQIRLAKNPRPFTKRRDIIKVELIYLPSYLFSISIKSSQHDLVIEEICVDAIAGEFAFFKRTELTTYPILPSRKYEFIISESEAEVAALDQYKKFILKQNLKAKSRNEIQSTVLNKKIYYPFWIGYFYRKGALDFEVLDGVSGILQGAKMRPVFINLLLQDKEKIDY